jgi:gamma-glutamylcyclotransferase (GGCT)/AIG2-like uncharacterized protein YtfP
MKPCSNDLLFAYGTLKKGGQYHHLIADKGAILLGSGTTRIPYPLILAEYPCLLDRPGEGFRVKGEVYRLPDKDAWKTVDRLEDHPDEYLRRREPVEVDGKVLNPWTYFYLLEDCLDPALKPVDEFPAS